jgi:hypothetical protein
MINKIVGSRSRFYKIWVGINSRVGKQKNYKNIKLSNEWKTFDNFYTDMYDSYCNHCKKHGEKFTTIERVDRYGDYCKVNCVWATPSIQANNRSNGRFVTYGGVTKSMSEWARELGLSRQAFFKRIESGWSLDRIFSTPKQESIRSLIEAIMDGVMIGKFGTKHRVELIQKLQNVLDLM